jgi:hypothetical protein
MNSAITPFDSPSLFEKREPKPDLSAAALHELLAQSQPEQVLPWTQLLPLIATLNDPPYFPKAALEYVDLHWPHYRTHVYEELLRYVNTPEQELNANDCRHIFAGCLLAHRRDADCFEIAKNLALFSNMQLENTLGDSHSELISSWFAAWCHHSFERVQWLREVSTGQHGHGWQMRYTCWAALAICGAESVIGFEQLDRDAIAFCEHFIDQMKQDIWIDPAQPDDIFDASTYVSFAICEWMDVCLRPMHLPLVKSWFTAGYVDEGTVDWGSIQRDVDRLASKPLLIDANSPTYPKPSAKRFPKSVFEEIGWWAWFYEKYEPSPSDDSPWHAADPHGDFYREHGQSLPFVRLEAKIGRNDPCSCGSGKKYKKCCGA